MRKLLSYMHYFVVRLEVTIPMDIGQGNAVWTDRSKRRRGGMVWVYTEKVKKVKGHL